MKIIYYYYYLREKESGRELKVDIRNFVDSFVKSKNINLKNKIKYIDDNIYLLRDANNFYLFLRTRKDEIIKKIDSNNLDIQDIYNLLRENEKLGFTSFIYFGDCFCGLASTMSGPKDSILSYFIEYLLKLVGVNEYEFVLKPMPTKVTKNEALRFGYIGKTVFEVNPQHKVFKGLAQTLGFTDQEVDGLEIIIKPKNRKNIKYSFSNIVDNILDEGENFGVKKFVFKAKNDINETLNELFIIGNGYVYDYINYPKEKLIFDTFNFKINNNRELQVKLIEFKRDKNYERDESLQSFFDNFSAVSWDNISFNTATE
ncbi:hypothetical protein [Deferribacter abyssi]|uniref:hypothetical protein n=1 Tax=Deferribacter abyssi TaxID=213806 RepID=UPI003C1AD77C